MNIAYSMTAMEKTTVLIEDEKAKSLYTMGWFSVSNDPVITSENAYNGKKSIEEYLWFGFQPVDINVDRNVRRVQGWCIVQIMNECARRNQDRLYVIVAIFGIETSHDSSP